MRLLNVLSSWGATSDPGVTLVTVDRWTLAELWSFGEDALYAAPLRLSDEDMVRLWLLAGRLYLSGEARWARPLSVGCLDY